MCNFTVNTSPTHPPINLSINQPIFLSFGLFHMWKRRYEIFHSHLPTHPPPPFISSLDILLGDVIGGRRRRMVPNHIDGIARAREFLLFSSLCARYLRLCVYLKKWCMYCGANLLLCPHSRLAAFLLLLILYFFYCCVNAPKSLSPR